MKIQLRLIISLFVVISIGFYILYDFTVNDIRPRYLETVEESMNDTAYLLASLLETDIRKNQLSFNILQETLNKATKKRFSSKIYQMKKTNVNLHVYVVDKKGIVLFDSNNRENEGKDFSKWNDVYLALQDQYGARSTRIIKDDPKTAILYVAAPIKYREKIIGAVTVAKPQNSVQVFMEIAKRKIYVAILLTFIITLFVSIIISTWITRPIIKLINYVKMIQNNKKQKLPKLGATEIRDLGMAFEELVEKLEGKKYIENYVHTLTHEIKSPLSSIAGASELLEEDLPDKQKKKYYKNIKLETTRIKEITDKLLDLTAVETQKELKKISKINIYKMINSIIQSLGPQIKQKSLIIINNINKRDMIKGEHFLIRHALLNLIQNAVNFSCPEGQIIIASEHTDRSLNISISDQGQGIPDYAIDKIFNKFYSLPSKDTKKKSTGLGLPFVKEVMNLHNAVIEIMNNDKAGVTVKLVFLLK